MEDAVIHWCVKELGGRKHVIGAIAGKTGYRVAVQSLRSEHRHPAMCMIRQRLRPQTVH